MEQFTMEEVKSRLIELVGQEKVTSLNEAHVAVVGIGGVGGSCALTLARSFIGHITVIDGDIIEPSNINRQALAYLPYIGQPKCKVAQEIIAKINPEAKVCGKQVFITKDNFEEVFEDLKSCDYIIDCIDSISQKVLLAEWAQRMQIPLISSMGAARKFNPCCLQFADIYQTSVCPVAKAVRKGCRKAGVKHLDVLYSTEEKTVDSTSPILGTMSYLPPIMGEMLAGFVICKLLGVSWQDGNKC